MSILPPIRIRLEHGLAIADYGNAIEIDPKYVPACGNRVEAYQPKGEKEAAAADRKSGRAPGYIPTQKIL